jgi:predicted RNase H-like HicB family nuclease
MRETQFTAMASKRRVLLRPGDDSGWVVECPTLPGCISQGTTKKEAIANIREAIALYEEVLREGGEEVPADDDAGAELAAA